MTRIGVISDTHIPGPIPELWDEVRTAFKGVDLILHGGDITASRVLDWLEQIAPVLAAKGNNDKHVSDPRVKDKQFLEIEGVSIGMVHTLETYGAGWTLDQAINFYVGPPPWPQIIISGDTHVEGVSYHNGTMLLNPGSPTLPRNKSARKGHVALLEIVNGQSKAEIIDLTTLASGNGAGPGGTVP
jgi:putative phosphoesterase